MKRIVSVILCVVLTLTGLSLLASAAEETYTYVSPDTATVILLPTANTETERYAAQTLQKYIFQITGKTLSVTTKRPVGQKAIVVGAYSGLAEEVAQLPDGGYILLADRDTLYISGSGTRGNIYGVFGFLENYCGCRWYTKETIRIPETDTITMPAGEKFVYKPYFEYTETDWRSPFDIEYSLAHGLCGGMYRRPSKEQGSSVRYLSYSGHTLARQFCDREVYFESHPEYYALVKGKRTSDQLCLTNPDVLRIVTEDVLNLLKAYHDPTEALQIVSLTQDDNQNFCTCPGCKALDEANDSHAGTMITFVNQVARTVKAAGYDNVGVDTFAYEYTRRPPKQVVPDDNVIVRVCSIECCFAHTLDDASCKENVNFMEDLRNWGKICNRIYIWDYTTNYSYYASIFPNFGVLQRNMQLFVENGAKGVYEEGNYTLDACNTEFGELRAYLLSKLMQNPYLDYEETMMDFLNGFYGEAAPYIRAYLEIITRRSATNRVHLHIRQWPKDALPGITAKEIREADELWAQAKAATSGEALENVLRSELSWRFWKSCNHKSEFTYFQSFGKLMRTRETLYQDIVDAGNINLGELPSRVLTENRALILLRDADKWCKLYEDIIWKTLEPVANWLYNLTGIRG